LVAWRSKLYVDTLHAWVMAHPEERRTGSRYSECQSVQQAPS